MLPICDNLNEQALICDDKLSHRFVRRFNATAICPPKSFVPLSQSVLQCPNLVLEIGAGRGKHAYDYAKANPTHHMIALERTKIKAQQLLSYKLPNLSAIHADAIFWSVYALPPACLSAVYILYPNPEPNNTNQRFVNMPYFEFLLSRLKPNATLIIASNVVDYIDEACQKLAQVWQLPFVCETLPMSSARTHFEMKYLARGEQCQQLTMTKPKAYMTAFDKLDYTKEYR